jgi:phytoene synthase
MLLPSPESTVHADDLAACHARLRDGSKSFAAAARLLPRAVRRDATALYAFCRDADDAVDLSGGDPAAVDQLRGRLDRIYAGSPDEHPVDRALAQVVLRHGLPRTLLDALLEGFAWDAEGRRYPTLDSLEAYAARVAGTVGAMMSVLMGVRSPEAIARACDLGVAMQLTNIARDVGEDARNGRLYLPLEWLAAAGIDADDFLARPACDGRLRPVVEALLRAADRLYARVDAGVAQLPPGCRPGIQAARLIYADIGRMVRRNGHDSVSRRAVVPGSRKLALVARAYATAPVRARGRSAPPLAAVQFLVEAVAASAPRAAPTRIDSHGALPWWQLRARALWVIELFERLEIADRERRGHPVDALQARASTLP